MLICDNWYETRSGREIPEDSFQLHSLHCARNIVKCECGLAIPRIQYTAHRDAEHVEVKCQHCEFRAPKYAFQHQCEEEPVVCQFCEAPFPQAHYLEHIYNCGSRTESCPKCLKYIPLRDFKFHIDEIDCVRPFARGEIGQDEQLTRQLQDNIYGGRHEEAERSPVFNEPRRTYIAELVVDSDDDLEESEACPICSLEVPVSLLPRHTSECLESSPYNTDDRAINEAILKSLQEQ